MRTLLALLCLAACSPTLPQTEVLIEVVPAGLTRPCLARRLVTILDNTGKEYKAPEGACNEASVLLDPGATFAGSETLELEQDGFGLVEDIRIYVLP